LQPWSGRRNIRSIQLVSTSSVTVPFPIALSPPTIDLHLLMNTLSVPSISNTSASWLPICLPKFNPSGFLHAYVSFIQPGDLASSEFKEEDPEAKSKVALTVITRDRDAFEKIRTWATDVMAVSLHFRFACGSSLHIFHSTQTLESRRLLKSVFAAAYSHAYPPGELGIPGLRHFLYKSKPLVQITAPSWEDPYDQAEDQRRCVIATPPSSLLRTH
jgi:vacuolar fusion protein MON1